MYIIWVRWPNLWFKGFINEVLTAKELIEGIVGGAEEILMERGIGGFRLAP